MEKLESGQGFNKDQTVVACGISEFLKDALRKHFESKGISVKKVLLFGLDQLDCAAVEISDDDDVDSLLAHNDLGPLKIERCSSWAMKQPACTTGGEEMVDAGASCHSLNGRAMKGPAAASENTGWMETVNQYTRIGELFKYLSGSDVKEQEKDLDQPDENKFRVEIFVMRFIFMHHWNEYEKLKRVCKVMFFKEGNAEMLEVLPADNVDKETFQRTVDDFVAFYRKIYSSTYQEELPTNKPSAESAQLHDISSEACKRFSVIVSRRDNGKTLVIFGQRETVLQAVEFIKSKLGAHDKKSVPTNKPTEKEISALSCRTSDRTTIRVYQGDIADEDADAIVNPANEGLNHGAGVALAIVNRGGKCIQDESKEILKQLHRDLQCGEVVKTTNGHLPCKFIIHAVGPRWNGDERKCRKLLHQACTNSLHMASNYGAKSIAIPAISSGIFGVPKNICASALIIAAQQFLNENPGALQDIRFVNIDQPTVRVFEQEMRKRYGNVFTTQVKLLSSSSGQETPARNSDASRQRELQLVKNSNQALNGPSSYQNFQGTNYTGNQLAQQEQWNQLEKKKSYADTTKQGYQGAASQPGAGENGQHHQSSPTLHNNFPGQNSMANDSRNQHPLSGNSRSFQNDGKNKEESEECCICLDKMTNPKTLSKCKHTFCSECIEEAFKRRNVCPVCFTVYGKIIGNQPKGSMRFAKQRPSLPGYEGVGTTVIYYDFPPGTQGPEHPNPGQRYSGTNRTAFLPDNAEGNKVFDLLKRAFEQRLTFTIGTSVTTRSSNQITWNDIHHKTNTHGGATHYGYPDPDYLRRVQDELAAKGIQ